MAEFKEGRPCVECDGLMDRRHGTLPVPRPTGPADFRRIAPAHTVVVARDPILPSRRRQ